MKHFFHSFLPLLRKCKIELFLLVTAFLVIIISIILYSFDNKDPLIHDKIAQEPFTSLTPSRMVIDIAGAVERPGVYEITSGARLKDMLIQAGGLSREAERKFIARNFNLAKLLVDQEKIYIPSQDEVLNGIFSEPQNVPDSTPSFQSQIQPSTSSTGNKIDINAATLDELDTLPGIGKVTAQKIIQNRPYKTIEELLSRKILNKNMYENIKNIIMY